MLTARYVGDDTVRVHDARRQTTTTFKARGTSGVMPQAARQLLASGHAPSETISVLRNEKPVYDRDYTLEHWSKLTVNGGDSRGRSLKFSVFMTSPWAATRSKVA